MIFQALINLSLMLSILGCYKKDDSITFREDLVDAEVGSHPSSVSDSNADSNLEENHDAIGDLEQGRTVVVSSSSADSNSSPNLDEDLDNSTDLGTNEDAELEKNKNSGNDQVTESEKSEEGELDTGLFWEEILKNPELSGIDDFIDRLPLAYKTDFVLMRETKSRHLASLKYPRIIIFGPDARNIFGISTDPNDPNYLQIEIINFNKQNSWDFFIADFQKSPPRIEKKVQACTGCHASPLRVIWADYPEWPGAMGDSVPNTKEFTPEEILVLENIKQDPSLNPRISKLVYSTRQGKYRQKHSARRSSYNVEMTREVTYRQATSIYQTLLDNKVSEEKLDWYLFLQFCGRYGSFDNTADILKDNINQEHLQKFGFDFNSNYGSSPLLHLLGVELSQLDLKQRASELDYDQRNYGEQGYFAGEESLHQVVAFLLFKKRMDQDSNMKRMLNASQVNSLEKIYYYNFAVEGVARLELFEDLKSQYSSGVDVEDYYFSRFFDNVARNSNFCSILNNNILGR